MLGEFHILGIVSFYFFLVTKLLIVICIGQNCLLNALNINVNVSVLVLKVKENYTFKDVLSRKNDEIKSILRGADIEK